MAIPTRLIRRRIKSVRSTNKIMKAMELVAASKMRKAVSQALASRPYASLLHEMATEARGQRGEGSSENQKSVHAREPLTNVRKTLLVVIASDRGLCGGFNNQLTKTAMAYMKEHPGAYELVTIGRRAETVARRSGLPVMASFSSIANAPSFESIPSIVRLLSEEFVSGRVWRILFVYTHFKSALIQTPEVIQIFPVEEESAVERFVDDGEVHSPGAFEPDASRVLEALLPRMIEMRVYQALLESSASEHSARMMAMRSAGDAASEMMENLTFTLNQARQAAITREISEISAGKAAIE